MQKIRQLLVVKREMSITKFTNIDRFTVYVQTQSVRLCFPPVHIAVTTALMQTKFSQSLTVILSITDIWRILWYHCEVGLFGVLLMS